jgi:ATP-dependent Lhr-like helicase
MLEKVDLARVKQIMHEVKNGKIKVSTICRSEKPTPLAYHMLEKHVELAELMAPEEVLQSNIEKMKMAIEARRVNMLCMNCGAWSGEEKIGSVPEHPKCGKCGSMLLAPLYPSEDARRLIELMHKRIEDKELAEEDLRDLAKTRRMADLVLSYGRKAVIALEVKGVGPETASRILGKMHPKEDQLYMDLLKAKVQYLKTKPFWEDKKNRVNA